MIWQFHHQFKDGHTEMKSQSEDTIDPEYHQKWVKEQVKLFPPPDNAQNMICNQQSEFFVGMEAV